MHAYDYVTTNKIISECTHSAEPLPQVYYIIILQSKYLIRLILLSNIFYLPSHFFTDVDECVSDTSGCEQQCNNTIGSYYCTCSEGYSLENDNHSCAGM